MKEGKIQVLKAFFGGGNLLKLANRGFTGCGNVPSPGCRAGIANKSAFTLAEVLITLAIVGIVAVLTIPNLISKYQEKIFVTSLLRFNSNLLQAISLFKNETDGIFGSGNDADRDAFEPIAKYMKVAGRCYRVSKTPSCSTASWLPDYNVNYYGEVIGASYATVAKNTFDNVCYLLFDGTTFCIDIDPAHYNIAVDVNGKQLPNRVGQDIFYFSVGEYSSRRDLIPGYRYCEPQTHAGLCCSRFINNRCNSDNIYPGKDLGAFPTAYVLKHRKLPPKFSR
ncbi:MAG: type II secretion system GspH family protein [Muribaculaceae bacterium]|nr:type II secretion system GspH family protein [Muribaculaceae bacterium]